MSDYLVYWLFNNQCGCVERCLACSGTHLGGMIGYTRCWPAPLKRHRGNGIPFTDWVILFRGNYYECRQLEWQLRPHERIGWNIAPGGGHLHRLGARHRPETIQELSEIARRRPPASAQTREKLRITSTGRTNRGRTGQKKSDEDCQKISRSRLGKKLSPEHNAKLQAARLPAPHTGHPHTDETKE